MLIALINLWWAFATGFSGQTLYDGWAGIGFNLIFTALPVVIAATIDADVAPGAVVRYPVLYQEGQRNQAFSRGFFFRWMFSATFSSFVSFFLPVLLYGVPSLPDGTTNGVWDVNTAVYTSAIVVCNLKLFVETHSWTGLYVLVTALSISSWFIFGLVYCSSLFLWLSPHMLWVVQALILNPIFFPCIFITAFVSLLPDVIFNYYQRNYYPASYQIVQEIYKNNGKASYKEVAEFEMQEM
eukprot:TRINITY_DN10721_c0_g1_i1.p1 TRINITY_DN10721_c0_g1~~TRINITY_DN10721_c0_g1_i1.p1  ORF type:complete len:240 (+),score=27.89 TRINITY_DN10721_c0_g1_i1:440-1159(+)